MAWRTHPAQPGQAEERSRRGMCHGQPLRPMEQHVLRSPTRLWNTHRSKMRPKASYIGVAREWGGRLSRLERKSHHGVRRGPDGGARCHDCLALDDVATGSCSLMGRRIRTPERVLEDVARGEGCPMRAGRLYGQAWVDRWAMRDLMSCSDLNHRLLRCLPRHTPRNQSLGPYNCGCRRLCCRCP